MIITVCVCVCAYLRWAQHDAAMQRLWQQSHAGDLPGAFLGR